ncbi:MAG TPA: aminotransferase, partial [Agromyces sp.]|nr:aminotransferase [Agromyces sp.]
MHGARSGFDFFTAGELPAPTLPAEEVAAVVRERWGLDVTLEPLGSQQDQNFLARAAGERSVGPVGVVKITNPAFTSVELAAQDAAAERIAAASPGFRIATTSTAPGTPCAVVADTSEGPLAIRLIDYLPGGTLNGDAYLSPAVIARMGELAARASLALAGFEHPGLERVL